MKQSKLMSLLETILSTAIGFGVALLTQIFVFPLFGFHPAFHENLAITAIFTVVSMARQFVMRRLFEALHIRRPLSPFMQAVIAERFRQIEGEGWSKDHDAKYPPGVLAKAGASYAIHAGDTRRAPLPIYWPWDVDWWKPQGFRRDLVRAGALVIAEGEKFDDERTRRGTR